MPNFEMIGTVKEVRPVQTFASGFAKRELIVTSEDDRYPQDIPFEFLKEKMDLIEDVQEATRVKVHFDLRGREYQGRYFLSANGWRIEKLDETTPAGSPDTPPPSPSSPTATDEPLGEADDDVMPF